jgi:hypothetical protein
LPEDVAPLAALLGLGERQLFERFLVVEYWSGQPDDLDPRGRQTVFELGPALKTKPPGRMAPTNPIGECIFFDAANGRCKVHAAKHLRVPRVHPQRQPGPDHRARPSDPRRLGRRAARIVAIAGFTPEIEFDPVGALELMLGL